MNYEPQVRSPRGVDPQVRHQSGRCDVCNRSRAHHKHDKCSKARQAAGFVRWKEPAAGAPVTCVQCKRMHRFDEMMGNTCKRCYADTMYRAITGEMGNG